ncbi:TonB-dependent receptor [Gelatiniphilus marinus]|uniref:TonB-dependent receptor n=1 Tax=Gelatiniphilus marinus TaxID=1759464 RepID=A0ABW5JLR6_9FLAO
MKIAKSLFLVAVMLPLASINAHETGTISGKIISPTNKPLDRVSVALVGTQTGSYTNEKGLYSISDVKTGEYILEATAIGFKTFRKTIIVEANKTTIVDITLYETPLELNEIVVKGAGLKKRNRTETVSTINLLSLKELSLSNPFEILNQVPGVEIGAYNQGGVADVFIMRGFNGGGHSGEAAIEIDGVSLNEGESHSDGYADVNSIIPLNISKVDVYKGPSSALFGRFGMAGTLAFETRKGGEYQDLSLKGGSYETFDAQVALGNPIEIGEKTLETNFAAQLFRTNGFTENSKFFKGNLNARVGYQLTDATDIALTLMGYSGNWNGPGYIPTEQFNDKHRRFDQAINAENDGGSKVFASERFDINHTFNDNLRLLVFGYAVQQDFQRFAKFGFNPGGQTEYFATRNVYATGANLNGQNAIGATEVNWISGIEYFNENTDYERWNTSNRVRNGLSENRLYKLNSFAVFGQAEFDISPYFRPTIGLRYDVYNGNMEILDPGVTYENKPLNDLSHISPKFGFRSTLIEGFDFRVNISNGFSLPSGSYRYNKDTDLDPSEIWQYEAGLEYNHSDKLSLNLTGFILNSTKEINETAPGSGVFINAGKTQRSGLEFGIKAQPVKRLNFNGSLTYFKTEITKNQDQSIVGKELSNVPKTITTASVDYTFNSGFGARLNVRDVGKWASGIENFFYYGGYTRTDAKLFYNFAKTSPYKGQLFIEINNMFDEHYSTFAYDNGGPADGQAYSVAAPRNISIGVSYNF